MSADAGTVETTVMQDLELRVITGADVRRLLPYDDCVATVASAMIAVSAGTTIMPLRQVMRLPRGQGALGTMPGYLGEPECFGIKLLSLFPGNPAVGLSSHLGLYVLCEAGNGRPVALMEASALTAVRTAAASVVATRALARADSSVLAIIGTGEEAHSHVEAFQAVRPFERLLVWGRNPAAAARLADRARQLGIGDALVVSSVRQALAEADVVCTVTSSPDPLLSGADVRPGTHLCLVGASIPSCREVDDACVAMSRFFVDYRASAMAQAGELLHAIEAGLVTEAHIVAEIGEVLAGDVSGRRSDSEVTVYKSLGVAAQDLAAASVVYQRAVESGAGTLAPI
jgi:ornithine cyclodeaminase/alanine dehydrogenase-like protein (mu-crystallin family)